MTTITFPVTYFNIEMGQNIPVIHEFYQTLPMQGIIKCYGPKGPKNIAEQLTIYFLPDQLSPTKPLTDLKKFGGIIFVNFKDYMPYIELLRNQNQVWGLVDDDNPFKNRLFTDYLKKQNSKDARYVPQGTNTKQKTAKPSKRKSKE